MSAYYLRNVVPQWSLGTIYRGMADYMVIQVIALIALFMWPDIALWLVRALRRQFECARPVVRRASGLIR